MKFNKTVFTGAMAICVAATLWGLDGVVLTPRLYSLDIGLVVFIFHALAVPVDEYFHVQGV